MIMKAETWDMLGRGMRKSLQKFIKPFLLETFNIIFREITLIVWRIWKFELIEEELILTGKNDKLIFMIELRLTDDIRKYRVLLGL